jgi:hypothetical protein
VDAGAGSPVSYPPTIGFSASAQADSYTGHDVPNATEHVRCSDERFASACAAHRGQREGARWKWNQYQISGGTPHTTIVLIMNGVVAPANRRGLPPQNCGTILQHMGQMVFWWGYTAPPENTQHCECTQHITTPHNATIHTTTYFRHFFCVGSRCTCRW